MPEEDHRDNYWHVIQWFFRSPADADRLAREYRSPQDMLDERAKHRDAVAWVEREKAARAEIEARKEARRAAIELFWKRIWQTFLGVGAFIGVVSAIRAFGQSFGWWQ